MTFLPKWYIAGAILLATYGCIPAHLVLAKTSSTSEMQDLKVNENFDFTSTRNVQLGIKVRTSSLAGVRSRTNVVCNDLSAVIPLRLHGGSGLDFSTSTKRTYNDYKGAVI